MSESIDLGMRQFLMSKSFSVNVALKGHHHFLT